MPTPAYRTRRDRDGLRRVHAAGAGWTEAVPPVKRYDSGSPHEHGHSSTAGSRSSGSATSACPTAAALATRGVEVVGVDVNPDTVKAIARGEAPFVEPDLAVAVSGAVAMGRLTATMETPEADAYIIAVPTPFNDDHSADLSYVRAAAEQIAPQLRGGEIVILESTSPPGTTEQVSEWLGDLRPDLMLPHAGEGIPDVYVAHCPERVLPGRIMIEMVTNDRVSAASRRAARRRPRRSTGSSPRADPARRDAASAEMAKLVENAYRDVNIAFANELSLICEKLRARRVGGHPARQPPPAGQHPDARSGRRRALHRRRPVVHRRRRARTRPADPDRARGQRPQARPRRASR